MEVSRPAAAGTSLDHPRWWPVIVGVFVGYLWALLALGLVGLALYLLGVFTWSSGPHGEGWLVGPFEPDGAWSLAADAVVAFTVLATTSGFVVWALSYRVHRRVSWTVAFLALGLTGYAPFFYFEGRLRLSGIVGLLLSAALVRWFGIAGTQPADLFARLEERLAAAGLARRRLAFALVVCWAGALGIGVAYGVTHPFRISGGEAENVRPLPAGGDTEYTDLRGPAGAVRTTFIFIDNNGFAGAHALRAEAAPDETLPLRRAVFGPEDAIVPPRDEAATTTIPGREARPLFLSVTIPRCAGGFRTLERIRLRYTVLGREQSQLLRLDPPLAARCASRERQ